MHALSPAAFEQCWVFPEPVIAPEAFLPFMVCTPVYSGSLIDWI